MTVALVLGGGGTLSGDVEAYTAAGGTWDGVVACNDAIPWWPHELTAGVSLHCRYFDIAEGRRWRVRRLKAGYPDAEHWFGHEQARRQKPPPYVKFTNYLFPGTQHSGSSGLFACKVALVDLGFDNAVLCGIPMTPTPHMPGTTHEDTPWEAATGKHGNGGFRAQWPTVPDEYLARMRSMSGWTRQFLGAPDILTKAA